MVVMVDARSGDFPPEFDSFIAIAAPQKVRPCFYIVFGVSERAILRLHGKCSGKGGRGGGPAVG